MRRGMRGLALQVQEGLGRDPFAGDVYLFRGGSGALLKALWHDGIGLLLYAKLRIPTIARMYSDLMPRSVPI